MKACFCSADKSSNSIFSELSSVIKNSSVCVSPLDVVANNPPVDINNTIDSNNFNKFSFKHLPFCISNNILLNMLYVGKI